MDNATAARQLGIIDIGAHSIRLEIFQIDGAGNIAMLDRLSREVDLGFDVFRDGNITAFNINRTCEIMSDFAGRLAEYRIVECHAVATSAVREAMNRELLLNRVELASGIRVKVLESQEEARLLFAGIRRLLQRNGCFPGGQGICFAIGTGSLIVMYFDAGRLQFSETTALGSVRMFDEVGKVEIDPGRILDLLESLEIRERLVCAAGFRPEAPVALFGVGAGLRAMLKLREIGDTESDLTVLSAPEVAELTARARKISERELAERYFLVDHLAVSVAPSCCIADYFLRSFGAPTLTVPAITTRYALLQDIIRTGGAAAGEESFLPDLIASAENIGNKYNFDLGHARLTAAIALKIFDKLRKRFGMVWRDRVILEIGALLHDIGRFVDVRQHHKHSWYLIANSQLPGLAEADLALAAAVARYHRRSMPKPTHPEFSQFCAGDQVTLLKLAAILRVADALVRTDNEKYRSLTVHLIENTLILKLAGNTDMLWETIYLAKKGDLFQAVFGLKLKFEENLQRA